MTKNRAADFIIFAIIQARGAKDFGFTPNECCRNLKIALHQYWQNKILKKHGQVHKANIPRSIASMDSNPSDCIVEHAVPLMTIVNKLIELKHLTRKEVIGLLNQLFTVAIITKEEHSKLNSSGLRSTMPADWDGIDPFARYAKVAIEISKQT